LDRQELFDSINQKLAANDIEGAVDLAEVALALGETHPTLLNLCAHRLEVQGDFPGALKLLDQALQIAPDDVSILSAIGHCWIKQAEPVNALRAFSAALARHPGFAPAHYRRRAGPEGPRRPQGGQDRPGAGCGPGSQLSRPQGRPGHPLAS